MPERKSWDVVRKQAPRRAEERQAASAAPAPRPKRPSVRVDDMRPAQRVGRTAAPSRVHPRTAPAAAVVRRTPRAPQRPSNERLRERRRRARKAWILSLAIMAAVLLAVALYTLWLPSFRIQQVHAATGDERAAEVAHEALVGSYAHVIPHDSIFFFPKERVRQAILDAYPDVAAVSISRDSFSSITVATTPRAKAFTWCGTSIDTPSSNGCFDTDVEGLIFEPTATASTTPAVATSTDTAAPAGELRIFAPLDKTLTEGESPVRSHVVNATAIPDAFRFIKAIRGMGASVSSLVLRGDEADLWIGNRTRITYVLGHEQEASELAASTLSKLPLNDGSIQYIDMRFSGKVYVKRYGQ